MFPNRSCSIGPELTRNTAIFLGFATNPDVAKVRVDGSNPFARSSSFQ
jgi:hypothetical protein